MLQMQVILPAAAAVMLAGNKVLHKMAMVPMQPYVLYLTFAQTVLYVVVYGAILKAGSMCAARRLRAAACLLRRRAPLAPAHAHAGPGGLAERLYVQRSTSQAGSYSMSRVRPERVQARRGHV